VDLVHVALPDFEQVGWGPPGILIVLSSLLMFHRPYPGAFLLAVLAHAWTLLGLRDVLTQSMLLLIFGMIGFVVSIRWRPRLFRGMAHITGVTYLAAAIHKLNTNFLDLELSCAVHALNQVEVHWGVIFPDAFRGLSPHVALGIELALWVSLSFRSRWYWLLAVAFHLPLLVTLAPAFGAVMFCGAACMIEPRDLVRMKRLMAKRYRLFLAIGFLSVGLEYFLAGGWLSWTQPLQVGGYIVAGLTLFTAMRKEIFPRPANTWLGWCWLLFCLTPYLGLQYQHTAAMLSNLRVDTGCHNSLIFPKAWVGQDTYVRIQTASFGTDEWSDREDILEAGLWNEAALFTMRRKWCVDWVRPISMTIEYRGNKFELDDICHADAFDFIPARFHSFPQFQRFQKNLTRKCDQACIH